MCQTCKEHPEVVRCPSCRIQFTVQEGEEGGDNLMRNIPMEKLARSFYERRMQQHRLVRHFDTESCLQNQPVLERLVEKQST